jgi:hypothetical protein
LRKYTDQINNENHVGACIGSRASALNKHLTVQAREILSAINLSGEGKDHYRHELKQKEKAFCTFLEKEIQKKEFVKDDFKVLRWDILINLPVNYAKPQFIGNLFDLDVTDFYSMLEKHFLSIQAFLNEKERFTNFVFTYSIKKIKAVLTTMDTEIMHNIDMNLFLNIIRDPVLSKDKKDFLLTIFPCLIRNYSMLDQVLSSLSAEQSDVLLKNLKDQLPRLVTTAFQLVTILESLAVEQREILLAHLKDQLPRLVTDVYELANILKLLSVEQREILLAHLKDQLPRLITNAYQLANILKLLSVEQTEILLTYLKDPLPRLIQDTADLNAILNVLSMQQCDILLQHLQGELPRWIDTAEGFYDLIQKYPRSCRVILQGLRKKLSHLVSSEEVLCKIRYRLQQNNVHAYYHDFLLPLILQKCVHLNDINSSVTLTELDKFICLGIQSGHPHAQHFLISLASLEQNKLFYKLVISIKKQENTPNINKLLSMIEKINDDSCKLAKKLSSWKKKMKITSRLL